MAGVEGRSCRKVDSEAALTSRGRHYSIFIRSLLDSYSMKTGEAITRPRPFRKRKDKHRWPLLSVLSKPKRTLRWPGEINPM